MKEVVELQASAVVNVTKENVKRKSEERLKLDIEVDSPVIVIPAASKTSNHYFSFGLGTIH